MLQIFLEGLGRLLCVRGDDHIRGEFHSIEEDPATPAIFNGKQNGSGSMMGNRHVTGGAPSERAIQHRQLEWRTLASVIDRLFFILYIIGISLTMIFVFPR